MVRFTPLAALTPGKDTRYPLDRRLGVIESPFARCGEETNLLPLPGIERRPSNLVRLYTERAVPAHWCGESSFLKSRAENRPS
jgi:hypothetical protein